MLNECALMIQKGCDVKAVKDIRAQSKDWIDMIFLTTLENGKYQYRCLHPEIGLQAVVLLSQVC
jgi:hypothetical protein